MPPALPATELGSPRSGLWRWLWRLRWLSYAVVAVLLLLPHGVQSLWPQSQFQAQGWWRSQWSVPFVLPQVVRVNKLAVGFDWLNPHRPLQGFELSGFQADVAYRQGQWWLGTYRLESQGGKLQWFEWWARQKFVFSGEGTLALEQRSVPWRLQAQLADTALSAELSGTGFELYLAGQASHVGTGIEDSGFALKLNAKLDQRLQQQLGIGAVGALEVQLSERGLGTVNFDFKDIHTPSGTWARVMGEIQPQALQAGHISLAWRPSDALWQLPVWLSLESDRSWRLKLGEVALPGWAGLHGQLAPSWVQWHSHKGLSAQIEARHWLWQPDVQHSIGPLSFQAQLADNQVQWQLPPQRLRLQQPGWPLVVVDQLSAQCQLKQWATLSCQRGQINLGASQLSGDLELALNHSPVSLGAQLSARLNLADLARVLPPAHPLGQFVEASQISGQLQLETRWQGALAQLSQLELWQASGRFSQLGLRFDPAWPRLEQAQGTVVLSAKALQIKLDSAHSGGLAVGPASLDLTDVMRQPRLAIKLEQALNLSSALNYLSQTPLAKPLAVVPQLKPRSTSPLKLQLALLVPLDKNDPKHLSVQGKLDLPSGLNVEPAGLPLLDIKATSLSFSESGFAPLAVEGKVLGGPIRLKLSMDKGLELAGQFNTTALWRHLGLDLSPYLSGNLSYGGSLSEHQGQMKGQFRVEGVRLPQSLIHQTLGGIHGADIRIQERDGTTVLSLGYGPQLKANLWLQQHKFKALSVGIGGGEAPPPPKEGVLVRAKLERVDVSRWLALLDTLPSAKSNASSAAEMPLQLELLTSHLIGDSRDFGAQKISLGLHPQQGLQVQMAGAQIEGRISWKGQQLEAKLSKLAVPGRLPGATDSSADALRTRPRFKSVELEIQELSLPDNTGGRLKLSAKASGQRAVVERLHLGIPGNELEGSGEVAWLEPGPNQLKLNLNSRDIGRLVPGKIKGGEGKLSANLRWQGYPEALKLAQLAGEFEWNLSKGVFLKAEEPEISRLLGVFDLETLPDKLLGGVGELFEPGVAFQSLTGQASLETGGMLKLKQLSLQSAPANVEIQGQVDLIRDQLDLRAKVQPKALSGAMLTATLAANPVVGLAAYLAGKVFNNPFGKLVELNFSIKGSPDKPEIKAIEGRQ